MLPSCPLRAEVLTSPVVGLLATESCFRHCLQLNAALSKYMPSLGSLHPMTGQWGYKVLAPLPQSGTIPKGHAGPKTPPGIG